MGNGFAKLAPCCTGGATPIRRRRHISAAVTSDPYDESLGHSFCYVRPDPSCAPSAAAASAKVHNHAEEATTFRSISGASVSANASTPLSTSLLLNELTWPPAAAAFESSDSFAAVPLQLIPRFSGPLSGPLADPRGFMSGPIERGFMSGPLDARAGLFSGPLEKPFGRSLSLHPRSRRAAASLLRGLTRAISRTIARPTSKPKEPDSSASSAGTTDPSSEPVSVEDSDSVDPVSSNVQWAQGKAGEDRVHVVVSEEHGWVFVGIYDGFNGPDATDYLLSNLYSAVQRELKGLLWEDKLESHREPSDVSAPDRESDASISTAWLDENVERCKEGRKSSNKNRRSRGAAKKWEENQRRWKCQWDRERLELDRRLKAQLNRTTSGSGGTAHHQEVLKALSRALKKTEAAYLDIADKMVLENPELALMGSCVLVMLMKGDDVYLMNVGDSRAVLAHKAEPSVCVWGSIWKARQDLERIKEETLHDLEAYDHGDGMNGLPNLAALQLTLDHSTCVQEEVRRIRNQHPDDASAIVNDRVKGSLKVTRAFGAGYLKQPKWNDALLEVFRIDYVGASPYISCNPYLYHHRLGPKDRFLILSSDGLYQYFTNEEAVSQVEMFIETFPEGDPAQHLVEEVLVRAANKAGMDFHELLEIPQGDRRRYHDDVSIIVISLEGRIWRSGM